MQVSSQLYKVLSSYANEHRPNDDYVNTLVYGQAGIGKTTLVTTIATPVLMFSFDPKGTEIPELNKMKAEGNLIVIDDMEYEDPFAPTAWVKFREIYDKIKLYKGFAPFASVVVDSATMAMESAMNRVLQLAGRVGTHAHKQDYAPQMAMFYNEIVRLANLENDLYLFAHEDTTKNEATGVLSNDLLVTGKLKRKLPAVFQEVYAMVGDLSKKGEKAKRMLQLEPSGLYKIARSRLNGQTGALESLVEPDIRALREKVGKPLTNKEPINLTEGA